jgi:hypothetical protein
VLEDDGEYHQYSRVHSRLGSNWVESPKQTEALTQVRTKLSQLVDTPAQFDNYLKFLENKYKINLDGYQGKTDAKSRDTIVNIVRDKMSGTNSQRALDAGSAVDSIIRQYFTVRDVSKIVKPSNMSENAFIDLITTLNRVKSNMEQMGERFLADNIVLFQKYPDGTRVAGVSTVAIGVALTVGTASGSNSIVFSDANSLTFCGLASSPFLIASSTCDWVIPPCTGLFFKNRNVLPLGNTA